MTEVLVHVRHLRAARMCNREPRLWFKRHGLSWTEFVTTGIPESKILATNDSLCLPVVEVARREAAAGDIFSVDSLAPVSQIVEVQLVKAVRR